MTIYNFTQHLSTKEQIKDGIIDVKNKKYICKLETFDFLPSKEEIKHRAILLSEYALEIGAKEVMIGGAFYLMPFLVKELNKRKIVPYYAFTKRESTDIISSDGSIRKESIFVYKGLIRAYESEEID